MAIISHIFKTKSETLMVLRTNANELKSLYIYCM